MKLFNIQSKAVNKNIYFKSIKEAVKFAREACSVAQVGFAVLNNEGEIVACQNFNTRYNRFAILK